MVGPFDATAGYEERPTGILHVVSNVGKAEEEEGKGVGNECPSLPLPSEWLLQQQHHVFVHKETPFRELVQLQC